MFEKLNKIFFSKKCDGFVDVLISTLSIQIFLLFCIQYGISYFDKFFMMLSIMISIRFWDKGIDKIFYKDE